MSKFQELKNSRELLNKEKDAFNKGLNERITKISKQEQKLKKEFDKKVKKLFGRVKFDLIVNDSKLVVELNGKEVFKFTYDTFTFKNIDKELAVELQNLYLEYYGEPVEDWSKTYETLYVVKDGLIIKDGLTRGWNGIEWV